MGSMSITRIRGPLLQAAPQRAWLIGFPFVGGWREAGESSNCPEIVGGSAEPGRWTSEGVPRCPPAP